ncbi:hypothetical protein [Limosilactobacillus reuteri]|uniref:hypothetical protein n=1 Tax=Limosilactobacillus reuteri TaxID=1598 RepID=UPI001CC076E9|nr:hypothetical protein [Limosilactobacillus reuteri]
MWMQERNGKFRFFEQYKDPLTNKTKIISITMKDHKKSTAKQAQIILDNRISKALSKVGIGKIIHGITLKQLLDEYTEYEKPRIRRSTYYSHQTMVNTLLDIFGNDALVEKFTPLIITEKLESLMYGDRELSSGYVSRYKYYLHKFLIMP